MSPILSIIPAIVCVVIAMKTRRPFEPVIAGTIVAFILAYGLDFLPAFSDVLIMKLTDVSLLWVIIFSCVLCGLMEVISAVRASESFTKLALKYAKSEKKTFWMLFVMAFVIFPDEYLRVLTLNTALAPVSDKFKIPREMFGYSLSALGVPVVLLLPMTTWSIFFGGLLEMNGLAEVGEGMSMYMQLIPYSFFPILVLVIFVLVFLGVIPKLGMIKKQYQMVKDGTYDFSRFEEVEEGPDAGKPASTHECQLIDFILPLVVLFAFGLTMDMLIGTFAALIFCAIYYVARKYIDVAGIVDSFWDGFKIMVMPMGIMAVANCMSFAMEEMGFPELVAMSEAFLNISFLPVIGFIICGVLCYITGNLWGVPVFLLPAFIPLAQQADVNVLLTVAAIYSGACIGSITCVFSDLNNLIGAVIKVKPADIAISATPYALIAGVLSIIAYTVGGFIL